METATAQPTAEVDPLVWQLFSALDSAHNKLSRSKADLLGLIREFDTLGLAPEAGSRTTAGYLVRRFGIAPSTAHEYVHIAHRLGEFPYLEKYFSRGGVSYSAVRLLLKYLTEENEQELVDLACELGYRDLEIALTSREKIGGGGDAERNYYLRLHDEADGALRVHGVLNPADGAALKAGLKLGEISYYGLEDLLEEGEAIEEPAPARPSRKTASGFGLPVGRMLLQSLMGLVHLARTAGKSTLTTPAAHVNIVATHDGRAYMPNNIGAPSASVAGILANAKLRVSHVDESGLIINTGRQFRLATSAQINALLVMWGGQCAAPGCTHTRFLEMHHIKDWIDGGLTNLDNLLPLCSACHSMVSDGYLKTLKDGPDIHFIYRDGTRYVSRNYSMARRQDDALTEHEYLQLIDEELASPDLLETPEPELPDA